MSRSSALASLLFMIFSSACSNSDHDAESIHSAAADLALIGTSWQVVDIDGGGVVDASNVTLLFPEDSKVVGNSGCNRYFGTVLIVGSSISFGEAGATMMACPEALMNQEQHFFDALNSVVQGEFDSDSRFVLYDAAGAARIRAIAYAPTTLVSSSEQSAPMDKASDAGFSFECGLEGTADVRFLGPDTVELSVAGEAYNLPQERAASGAKYSADGVSFWNKGDEAVVEINEKRYSCTRL